MKILDYKNYKKIKEFNKPEYNFLIEVENLIKNGRHNLDTSVLLVHFYNRMLEMVYMLILTYFYSSIIFVKYFTNSLTKKGCPVTSLYW